MGIRDRPISPASPWQNGYAERLIGTVRRECLDRMLTFGEAHLQHVLTYRCPRMRRWVERFNDAEP
jgi:transposase InsO family protein